MEVRLGVTCEVVDIGGGLAGGFEGVVLTG